MKNISDAFAAVPGLTPLCRVLLHTRFRTITCSRPHYPPSHAGFARKAIEQKSCPAAFQPENDYALMPDERHAIEESKNGNVCFSV